MRGSYWWWDDAVSAAQSLAHLTGRRFRVHRIIGANYALVWAVSEVGV